MKQLVVGSRASKLALTQTNLVIYQLKQIHSDLEIEIEKIVTEGDQRLSESLPAIGGKGVFIKEIENALLDHKIDFAVHSLKDMPTEMTPGLTFAAILKRADARDALISRENIGLSELKPGAVVGTGSPRRACQLLAHRPDLDISNIRGNVDTRLRKLDEGEYDAILLASAGLERLGLSDRVTEKLEIKVMLPAVGQGALALQIRANDNRTSELLNSLNDFETEAATTAERQFLHKMGGGCSAPITAYAVVDRNELKMEGLVSLPDGSQSIRDGISGKFSEATELGSELAERLLANGAAEIIKLIHHEA